MRGVGLIGGGLDPTVKVLGLKDPAAAAVITCRRKNSAESARSARWSSRRSTTYRSASKTSSKGAGA